MADISITVSFSELGFHCWPDAPEEVAYLRERHRHKFGVELELKQLPHGDRAFEFHLVQAWAQPKFREILDSGAASKSCEDMASRLATAALAKYETAVTARVSEDGECWATVSAP